MSFSIIITTTAGYSVNSRGYEGAASVATSVATFETLAAAEAAIAAPHGVPGCSVMIQRLYQRNKLTLVRGLPGSGKTTWVKYQGDLGRHLEADMFFEGENGYEFNPALLPKAHAWCQKETLNSLLDGENVVVSNTFTQEWELAPYLNMAEAMGVEVRVVKLTTQFQNIHGVPETALEAMRSRWEDYPGETLVESPDGWDSI